MADRKLPHRVITGTNFSRSGTDPMQALQEESGRARTPVPEDELQLLAKAALGDTGQSRSVRYLLFLLPGSEDPTGFKGQGLIELRPLDRKLADAFLKVLDWWRGPTESELPLYEVLEELERQFAASKPKP
jgi:hypothetical protein